MPRKNEIVKFQLAGDSFLGNLIHQLIDLIQQEQPSLGVSGFGNASIDAPGDLVDVHPDFVNLPTEVLDLLRGLGPDRSALHKPDEVGPFAQAAGLCLFRQALVLLRRQCDVKMMQPVFICFARTASFPGLRPPNFRPQAA